MQKTPLAVAAFLTWTAGFVDAVGFISLGHIYTANMSGNSVSVGIQWASQNWLETVRRAWPVLAYAIGLLFCRILIEFGARERIRSIASIAFLIEIALLAPPLIARSPAAAPASAVAFAYIGLLALAMGIQNGAVTHFSSLTLHTGFVTGTLVKFAEEFAKYLTWAFDRIRGPRESIPVLLTHSFKQKSLRVALWLIAIWVSYVVGAYCGALGDSAFSLKSLTVPITALLVIIAVDLRRPLAIRDEQDQAKLSA